MEVDEPAAERVGNEMFRCRRNFYALVKYFAIGDRLHIPAANGNIVLDVLSTWLVAIGR
jgi:hypothetical protein